MSDYSDDSFASDLDRPLVEAPPSVAEQAAAALNKVRAWLIESGAPDYFFTTLDELEYSRPTAPTTPDTGEAPTHVHRYDFRAASGTNAAPKDDRDPCPCEGYRRAAPTVELKQLLNNLEADAKDSVKGRCNTNAARNALTEAYQKVLAERDATQKALADTNIGGIYDDFRNVPDAIQQMGYYVKEIEAEIASLRTERDALQKRIDTLSHHDLSGAYRGRR